MANAKCKICGNQRDNRTYEVREMMYACGDRFPYIQCSQCGCLQIAEVPADMSKYYANDYYSYRQIPNPDAFKKLLQDIRNGYCVFRRGVVGRVLCHLFPTTTFRFLSHAPVTRESRILDVGCGAGHLLFSLQELGFRNLLGIDPFLPYDMHYDNGLTIRKLCLGEVAGVWDLIMFHHSFEHIADGYETLGNVRKLLDDRGICVIRVPTVSSYAWEHYGVNWVQLDAPRHFWLHSTESMRRMARETGFDLFAAVYDSTAFQFWGSEQYVKGIPLRDDLSYAVNPRKSGFSKRQICQLERRAARLNAAQQGDQAAFYLRKTETSCS